MYEEELGQVIISSANVMNIKLYYHLTKMKQFEGGVVASRKFIADELNMSAQYTHTAFNWLIENHFITKRKFQGQTQFILHKISEMTSNKPAETVEKVDQPKENPQPRQEIVRKGGKTITRMIVEGF